MSTHSSHSLQRSAFHASPYDQDAASVGFDNANGTNAAMSTIEDPSQRSSSGSGGGRSSGRSKQNPQQQLSTIEKSVTHLLVATKQLLETLTMWSRGTATESEVSDVYVRLGYEFNIACRAFNAIGVETQDLGPVPDLLRSILEETLSQEASQASLDRFLPRIRDIIINLLHGLKKKQQKIRQRNGKDGSTRDVANGAGGGATRQASIASTTSIDTNLTQQLADVPSRQSSSRTFGQRTGSGENAGPELPPRTTSVQSTGGRSSPRRADQLSSQPSMHRSTASRETLASDSGSSLSSNALQNIPVIAPYPEGDTMPDTAADSSTYQNQDETPPRPPPKQSDALAALQRGGDLERRASRRFSAYQIQKHLGGGTGGIAMMPPAQNSPIPNRGRDVKDSMNAVRTRGTVLHSRARSKNNGGYEASPNRRLNDVPRISEELSSEDHITVAKSSHESEQLESPMVKTPDDKLGAYPFPGRESDQPAIGATINGPMDDEPFVTRRDAITPAQEAAPLPERRKSALPSRYISRQAQINNSPPQSQYVPESSPQPGKELTLFLQYKSKIKKFVLPDGGDLTVARLQLAFIEKFAWNTHNNGNDLPEMYIQDPVSGVRHELEDLSDVKERSVLVLNVEALDEVKRHIDDGIGGLRRIIQDIKTSVDDQQNAIQRVSDRQQDAAKEIAGLAAAPTVRSSAPTGVGMSRSASQRALGGTSDQLNQVQSLRRDLAVVRQTYTSFASDIDASMSAIRTKAASVKQVAEKARTPSFSSDTGRAYVNSGKKNLSEDSEKIVNRVDDLQDLVEDLRKDVVTRGVRPLPRQLESVSKDISVATAELKKVQEFLKREKPVWTKIWEKELQVVCDDRDLLTMQEELAADLEDDLDKAAATFALVEQATKQQNLSTTAGQPGATTGSRSASRGLKPLAVDPGTDPVKAKDGLLGEVRALQPNHETRLEAIERAEKARQRELESRKGGEFQNELGNFVEEGKLKKSGGVEEVERIRKLREEKTRREVYERVTARERAKAEKEATGVHGGGVGTNGDLNGAPSEVAADEQDGLDAPGMTYEGETSASPGPEDFVEAKEDATPPHE